MHDYFEENGYKFSSAHRIIILGEHSKCIALEPCCQFLLVLIQSGHLPLQYANLVCQLLFFHCNERSPVILEISMVHPVGHNISHI
jgi:hypothetical protein